MKRRAWRQLQRVLAFAVAQLLRAGCSLGFHVAPFPGARGGWAFECASCRQVVKGNRLRALLRQRGGGALLLKR